MTVELVSEHGAQAGQALALDPGDHIIGTVSGADWASDPHLATEHAALAVGANGVTVRDLGSAHGTFVNGSRVTEAPLFDGDLVQFGSSRFRVRIVGEPGAGTCPGCGLGLPRPGLDLCPRCGRPLSASPSDPPAARRFCSACGKPLPAGARFCGGCGHDSEQAVPVPEPASRAWPAWAIGLLAALLTLLLLIVAGGGVAIGLLLDNRQTLKVAPIDAGPPDQPVAAPTDEAAAVADGTPVPMPADGILLRYGGQPGDQQRYEVESAFDGAISLLGQELPLDFKGTSSMSQEVLEARDETLRMRLTMGPWNLHEAGRPYAGPAPGGSAPIEYTMDTRGRMVDVRGQGGGEPAAGPLPPGLAFDYTAITRQLSAMSLPEGPVVVGDTWDREATVPTPGGGSVTIRSRSRLEALEVVAGRPTARVVSTIETPLTMSLPMPDGGTMPTEGSMTGQMSSNFDYERGRLVKSRSDLAFSFTIDSGLGDALAGELSDLPGLGQLGDLGKSTASGTVSSVATLVE